MVQLNLKQVGRAALLFLLQGGLVFTICPSALAVRSVTLQWSPCNSPEVVGYNVHYGTTSRRYNRFIFANQASATITGLIEEQTYYFAVTSVSSAGVESLPSDEVSYHVPTAPSGTYYGLLSNGEDVRPDNAGSLFTVSSTPGRTYTGRIQIGSARYSFSGAMDENYHATNTLRRKNGGTLMLELTFGSGAQADTVYGSISDGTWISYVLGRLVETNSAAYAGSYTLILPGSETNTDIPTGDGFGNIKVTTGGSIRFAGCLADGTKVTFSGLLCRQRQWPLYLSLYSGGGLILGWLTFANFSASDLQGNIIWLKPASNQGPTPSHGFVYQIPAVGSFYDANLANYSSQLMNFSIRYPGGAFTNTISIQPGGNVTSLTDPKFSMKILLSQGSFQGKATATNGGSPWSFRGALFPRTVSGSGMATGTGQARCELQPQP